MFRPDTTAVQICINAFAPDMDLDTSVQMMAQLLVDYAEATEPQTDIVQPHITTD